MGKSKDLATGETRFVNTSGDTMTGALTVGGAVTVNPDADSSLLIKDGGTNALMMTAATGDELYIGANNEYAIRIKNDGTKDVAFDNGSRVTMPSQPMFLAYNTTNDTFSSSDAKMAFNSTRISVGSHFDTSNHRFVAPIAGYYLFTWGGSIAHSAGDAYITAYLRKNGSPANGMRTRANSTSSSFLYVGMAGAEVQYMAANDYMEVWHYSQNGNAYSVSPEYIFSGMLLG